MKNLPLSLIVKNELLSNEKDCTKAAQSIGCVLTDSKTGSYVAQDNAVKFGESMMQLATSDEVISSVCTQVGEPLDGETEEQFVNRASKILKNILMSKLNK